MQPTSSGAIDYKRLILTLTAHAIRFLSIRQAKESEVVIQGTGSSPEDFAIRVVEMLVLGELKHAETDGTEGLIRHLKVAMEHDILDALDRSEHKRVRFLDPIAPDDDEKSEREKALADYGDEPADLAEQLDGEEFKARVYALVENEPDLKEMATAIFEVNALKPREIAAVCMTTTEDIQNRKKRFGRLLHAQGFRPKAERTV